MKMTEQLKWCNACKQHKSIICFSKNRTKKDGLQATCKDCLNARNSKYYSDHQETLLASRKQYRADNEELIKLQRRKYHAENRDRLNQKLRERYAAKRDVYAVYRRKYKREHREHIQEYNRLYCRVNRARITARKRLYRAENPEKYKVYTQKRRTQKLNLPNKFTEYDWAYCLAYWNYRCAICGRSVDKDYTGYTLAADHWIPLSDPRPDNPGTVPENMLPLCHGINGCNNSKKNLEPISWLFRYLGDSAEQKLLEITKYFESIKDLITQTSF
jgi:predicted restriction endonuclease